MWLPTRERVAGTRSLSRNARHHRAPNCPCGRPSSGAEQTVLAQGAGDAVGMCAVHVARCAGGHGGPKIPVWVGNSDFPGRLTGRVPRNQVSKLVSPTCPVELSAYPRLGFIGVRSWSTIHT